MRNSLVIIATTSLLLGCTHALSDSDQHLSSIYERYGYDEKKKAMSFEERVSKQKLCEELGNEEYGNTYWDTLSEYRYSPKIDRCLLSSRTTKIEDNVFSIAYRILNVETNLPLFHYHYKKFSGSYSCFLVINDKDIGTDIWDADNYDDCPDYVEMDTLHTFLWKGLTE